MYEDLLTTIANMSHGVLMTIADMYRDIGTAPLVLMTFAMLLTSFPVLILVPCWVGRHRAGIFCTICAVYSLIEALSLPYHPQYREPAGMGFIFVSINLSKFSAKI